MGLSQTLVDILRRTTPMRPAELQIWKDWLSKHDSIANKFSGEDTFRIKEITNDDITISGSTISRAAGDDLTIRSYGAHADVILRSGYSTGDVSFYRGGSTLLGRFDPSGDFLIGTIIPTSANGGKVLVFPDNTADPTMGTNTAGFYGKDVSGTVEAFCVDEAGNATQLSSHYQPPGKPKHADVDMPTHTITSENCYTGERVTYDLHALCKAVETLTGEKLIYKEVVSKRDWNSDQAEKVAQQQAQIDGWNEKSDGSKPVPAKPKRKPDWIE